jgi:beta-glucosidase-like glycosyl hydrolase/CubicO group peptidase (beta-lactamase class C family)
LKKLYWIICLIFIGQQAISQEFSIPSKLTEIDKTLDDMSLREQVSQLMMVAFYPKKDSSHVNSIKSLIEKEKIGGLIVFQGTRQQVKKNLNIFQNSSELPLLTSIDGEWGSGMRLSDGPSYAKAMALGAIEQDSLIYFMGVQIAKELKDLGIYVNFAPVVDVNSNPQNPVIGVRSFGDDPKEVIKKAKLYMNGMQDNGVMAVLKHFPGHGDSDSDSHKTLPAINHDRARLDSVELKPFKELIADGAMGVMSAHLHVPALDDAANSISSFSPKIIKDLLKGDFNFHGLVYTDALNMKGASSMIAKDRLEIEALKAGNDILLMPKDVPKALDAILLAIKANEIDAKDIRESCRRVLYIKQILKIKAANSSNEDNTESIEILQKQLIRGSLTLLVNQNAIVPLKKLNQKRLVSISIGDEESIYLNAMLRNYSDVKSIHLTKKESQEKLNFIFGQLSEDDVVIVSFQGNIWTSSSHYGFSSKWRNFVAKINNQHPTILLMFGNPYTLVDYNEMDKINAVLLVYQNGINQQEIAAQAIMGGLEISGRLPVSISKDFSKGFGISVNKAVRLGYADPKEMGINPSYLIKIDSIVEDGIKKKAYPGSQVLIARKGKIVYNKSFGHFTYDSIQPVGLNNLYDIASITKIASTVLVLMKMQDKGILSLDNTLGDFLPELTDTSEYKDLIFRSILAHQSGLRSWIPFYLKTLEEGSYKMDVFSDNKSKNYSMRVAEDLYIKNSFKDSIYSWIIQTPLHKKIKYLYSDIGYYFFLRIIEEQNGNSLDKIADNLFYSPLNLRHTTYKPLEKFDIKQIVPTEDDTIFRLQLIQGDVHDPGAAMIGGVGGHAGLFSTASDLAVIMQMLLNNGSYGGEKFLSEEVIREYTKCQFCEDDNRRGAGFDKPVRDNSDGPTCNCISFKSFGHTGFTGTMVWADPEEELVFVFLSNRINPSAENLKLIRMNIRTKIQEMIYQSLEDENVSSSFSGS